MGHGEAGFAQSFLGHRIDLRSDFLDFFFGDDSGIKKFASEQATDGGVGIDFGIKGRLSETGFIPFVVAVAAVSHEVENDIFVKALTEFEGQLDDGGSGQGIIPIDMEDGETQRFSWGGAVASGAGVFGEGGEGDLVVDDNVDGAACTVALEAGEVEGLGDDALADESAIAVDEDGDYFFTFDGILAKALAGAGLALDDWVDGLKVAGVGGQRETQFFP